MSIEAKTLRALAKHSGYKPSTIFRMGPSEVLEMLVEKYPDIKEWNDEKAKAKVKELTSVEQEKTVEPPKDTKEPEPKKEEKPKRKRRTKAQIAADKKAEAAKEEVPSVVEKPEPTEQQEIREKPVRQRKKKKRTPVLSVSSGSSEDIAELRERLITLESEVNKLLCMADDISMFLAWFHNVKIDPQEPIEHLGDIDWAACIKDHIKR